MSRNMNLTQLGWREAARVFDDMRIPEWRKVPLPIVAAATAQDTALVIPAGSIILPYPIVVVGTAEATGATKTVDIGISGGDEDGFLNGVSVASAATVKGTLASGGQTLGALLSVDESGAGVLVPEIYVCTAATTICYTLGSDDFAELVAHLYLPVLELD